LNNEIKNLIFEIESEKERARDVYRSHKEASSTRAKRKFSYIIDIFVLFTIIYSLYLLKNSFGFENIRIFDKQFIMYITIIVLTLPLSSFLFPKK